MHCGISEGIRKRRYVSLTWCYKSKLEEIVLDPGVGQCSSFISRAVRTYILSDGSKRSSVESSYASPITPKDLSTRNACGRCLIHETWEEMLDTWEEYGHKANSHVSTNT